MIAFGIQEPTAFGTKHQGSFSYIPTGGKERMKKDLSGCLSPWKQDLSVGLRPWKQFGCEGLQHLDEPLKAWTMRQASECQAPPDVLLKAWRLEGKIFV